MSLLEPATTSQNSFGRVAAKCANVEPFVGLEVVGCRVEEPSIAEQPLPMFFENCKFEAQPETSTKKVNLRNG
jgi:hypothetical protein